jgi:hypothetical protein
MTRAEPAAQATGALLAARLVLVWGGVLLFFTCLDNYAFSAWAAPKPLHWVVLFIGATAALLVADARRPLTLLRSPVFVWAYCFALITTTWALWMRHSTAVAELLNDRYRSIAFLLAFAVLFDDPSARRAGVLGVAAATVFASAANIAELLGLVDFARIDSPLAPRTIGRAAGFYINPNGAGLIIAIGLAIAVPAIRERWRLPLVVLGTLGVAATFSRGAMVCLVILVLWLTWKNVLRGWYVIAALGLAAVIVVYAAGYLRASGLPLPDLDSRMTSDSGRVAVLLRAWEMFLEAPILGKGLGSTEDWNFIISSHNTYLNLGADHGVLGLLLVPALCYALVARNRDAVPLALVLFLAGFFIHDLLSGRPYLFALALFTPGAEPAHASTLAREAASRFGGLSPRRR